MLELFTAVLALLGTSCDPKLKFLSAKLSSLELRNASDLDSARKICATLSLAPDFLDAFDDFGNFDKNNIAVFSKALSAKLTQDYKNFSALIDNLFAALNRQDLCDKFAGLKTKDLLDKSTTAEILKDLTDALQNKSAKLGAIAGNMEGISDAILTSTKTFGLDLDAIWQGGAQGSMEGSKLGSEQAGALGSTQGSASRSTPEFEPRSAPVSAPSATDLAYERFKENLRRAEDEIKALKQELGAFKEKLENAKEDELTHTLTRAALMEQLRLYEQDYLKNGADYAASFVRIGGFSAASKKFGRFASDGILVLTSKILKEHFSKETLIGRYEGGVFLVVSSDFEYLQNALWQVKEIAATNSFLYKEEKINLEFFYSFLKRSQCAENFDMFLNKSYESVG